MDIVALSGLSDKLVQQTQASPYESQTMARHPDSIHLHPTRVGIFHDTLLPSLGLHSGLSVIAYMAARSTDRIEAKDWLWPSGQVINAWWSALGSPIYHERLTFSSAWNDLSWPEKALLFGVTAWGLRLFCRIASRSVERGRDDPRYDEVKQQPGFWKRAFFSIFLPEAVFQSIISLPFTAPFRYGQQHPVPEHADVIYGLAVGLFSAGFALETLADLQLEKHKRQRRAGLCREGVWSIVRHPK
jgi:steroid 5-alpha reductase family enzyme